MAQNQVCRYTWAFGAIASDVFVIAPHLCALKKKKKKKKIKYNCLLMEIAQEVFMWLLIEQPAATNATLSLTQIAQKLA